MMCLFILTGKKNPFARDLRKKKTCFLSSPIQRSFFCRGNYKSSSGYCRKSGKGCQRTGTGFYDYFPWRFYFKRSLSAGTQLLADGLTKNEGAVVDGEIICPFFPEGGRYTMDNIHYVKEQDNLVPAGMTEFAKDKTFGYKSSDLTEYVRGKNSRKI